MVAFALVMVGMVIFNTPLKAAITGDTATVTENTFRTYQFFASTTNPSTLATTTSATSTNIVPFFDTQGRYDKGYMVIAGAKNVEMYFSRGDLSGQGNTGSTLYKVQVTGSMTPSESDWYDFSKLVQATSTTVQASASIGAATSTLRYGMNLDYTAPYAVRCIVVETTDGEHGCSASATF